MGDNTFASGCYSSCFFPCRKGCSLFLPVEFVTEHSSKNIKEIPRPCYLMKARPHGIALVIKNQDSTHSLPGRATTEFDSLFEHLHYSVQCHSNITASQMMQLMEEIASMDHTAYDSFVCCITSDNVSLDVCELVDRIDRCHSLLGKPKLFFVNSVPAKTTQPPRYHITPDTFVMWSTQKGKISNSSLSTVVLNEVFEHRSMTADLISMTFEISALMSMFPTRFSKCSGNRISIGQGIEVMSQLSKAVYFLGECFISFDCFYYQTCKVNQAVVVPHVFVHLHCYFYCCVQMLKVMNPGIYLCMKVTFLVVVNVLCNLIRCIRTGHIMHIQFTSNMN